MKLLFCKHCADVFSLTFKERSCSCKAARGAYEPDGVNAWHKGGIPLRFNNMSFVNALSLQPEKGKGYRFEAFVIPKQCNTFLEKE